MCTDDRGRNIKWDVYTTNPLRIGHDAGTHELIATGKSTAGKYYYVWKPKGTTAAPVVDSGIGYFVLDELVEHVNNTYECIRLFHCTDRDCILDKYRQ